MTRLLLEIAAMIALVFFAGASIGWALAAIMRTLLDREDEDWHNDEVVVALPLPAPLALPPPRPEATPYHPQPAPAPAPRRPPPPLIEAEAIPVPPRARTRPAKFRPPALPGPRNGRPDPLQRLPGLDAILASRLHGIGVYHFGQIAAWTPQELAWVGEHLEIGDLPVREDWVGQAARLAIGERPTRPTRI